KRRKSRIIPAPLRGDSVNGGYPRRRCLSRGRRRRGLPDDVERLDDLGEMAGAGMALAAIDEGGLLFGADRLRLPAPRPETAAGRRVRRRRHVALEHDPLALAALAGLLDRDGRQERLSVRMRRPLVDVVPRPDL